MNSIKKDFTLMSIMLIPIAVAINFIGGNLVLTLKLPLYLDSIGTFLVGMLAGPWVGMVTGALSIAINSISDPTLLPYAILSALCGAAVGVLARKNMFSSVVKAVISAVLVAVVSVVVSVLLKYIFFGGFGTSGVSAMCAAMIAGGCPFWIAQFTAQMIAELPDKIISIIIPFFVVKAMSDRYLYKFPNGQVFINSKKKA